MVAMDTAGMDAQHGHGHHGHHGHMAMVIMDTGMAITGTVIMDMATTTTVMAIGTITITGTITTVTAAGGAVTGMDTAWARAGAGRLTVMSGSATESVGRRRSSASGIAFALIDGYNRTGRSA